MKGRALRRALETTDAIRVNASIPSILTTTELVSPDLAKEWLKKNHKNRPVRWAKVDEYARMMANGLWRLHDQGLMFDDRGDLLTGQTRLWAIIKADLNVYMRVSRGNPPESADLIDRGVPQSARDLASRQSGRAHGPTEASLARAICALRGDMKPSKDTLAKVIADHSQAITVALTALRGQKKTKELLMIVGALIAIDGSHLSMRVVEVPILTDRLRAQLMPRTASECWGRGAAFSLAMELARRLISAP